MREKEKLNRKIKELKVLRQDKQLKEKKLCDEIN